MTTAARTSDPSKLLWFVHPQYHKEMHECYQWKLQFSTMHAFSLSTLREERNRLSSLSEYISAYVESRFELLLEIHRKLLKFGSTGHHS